jgi:hypothetical protein
MSEVELTYDEETILEQLFFAEQRGKSPISNQELVDLTGLPIDDIISATISLQRAGYIAWTQPVVH